VNKDPFPLHHPTIGVVVPAYRAEASIGDVVRAVRAAGLPVVVVDDGSPDRTSECAGEAGAEVVRLPQNAGKGSALHAGIVHAHARGWTWMVAMDADGQHAPSALVSFCAKVESRAGVVVGARRLRPDVMPWPRVCSNRLTTLLLSVQAGCRLWDSQCGYRMYRVDACLSANLPATGRFEWESEALVRMARHGWAVDRVDVPTLYGDETSHIRPWRDTARFVGLWFRLWGQILSGRI
jgi:glycosyltransferase involved in cell wall biosynthesis